MPLELSSSDLSMSERIELELGVHFDTMNEIAARIKGLMQEQEEAVNAEMPAELKIEAGEVWKIRKPNFDKEFVGMAKAYALVADAAAKIASLLYQFNKINVETNGTAKAIVGGKDVFAAIEGATDEQVLLQLLAGIAEIQKETRTITEPMRYNIAGSAIIELSSGDIVCEVTANKDPNGAIQRDILEMLNTRRYL